MAFPESDPIAMASSEAWLESRVSIAESVDEALYPLLSNSNRSITTVYLRNGKIGMQKTI